MSFKSIGKIVFGIFLVSFYLVLSAINVRAELFENTRSLIIQGNLAYKENHYAEAIEKYEKALAGGYENGNLYYNLGNSYVKEGKLGLAALNYERAQLLMGADSDAKLNYQYVRTMLNLNKQTLPGNRLLQSVDRLSEGSSINGATFILTVIYFFILVLCALYLFFKEGRRIVFPLIVVLLLIGLPIAMSLKRKITRFNRGAIVIEKNTPVKYEPSESATTFFQLTEGSKVLTLERSGDWYKIQRGDGKLGWIKASALGLIRSP